jgi:hypothetical protein
MPTSDLSRLISSTVVPVVIISACGLLALAFYNRMAAIVSRLRAFQRERLREQERAEQCKEPELSRRRRMLDILELQTAHVTRRAKLIRLTLMFLLLTIGLLVCCCLMLGLSALVPNALYVAISLLITGLLSMLCSTIAAMMELKAALQPVELESQFVTDVLHEQAEPDADAA